MATMKVTPLTYEEQMAGLQEIADNYAKYGAENVLDPNELGYGYIPDEDEDGNLIADPDDEDFDPSMWEDEEDMQPVYDEDAEVDYFAEDALAKSVDGQVQVVTSDDDKRLVFGWAYMLSKGDGQVIIDRQGDFVDDEWEMESSAYQYVIDCRVGGNEHLQKNVATVVESMVFTQEKIEAMGLLRKDSEGNVVPMQIGWWLGMYVTDDNTWNVAKSGGFSGFSIHGTGVRTPVEVDTTMLTLRKYDLSRLNKALNKGESR